MNTNPIIKLPVAELKTAIGGLTKVIPRHSTLPVLGMIHVERDRQGWVHLTGTDLDTFLTLRLEAPAEIGKSDIVPRALRWASCRSSAKPARPMKSSNWKCSPRTNCCCATASAATRSNRSSPRLRSRTSREPPQITAKSVSLDEAARATLLDALACASDDETRVILNGAYLDVSKPTGHYAVATDGRHLFASNSLHLPLPSSVLIPDHRFLSWSGFVKDGQWKLAVQPAHEGQRRLSPVWKAAAGRS